MNNPGIDELRKCPICEETGTFFRNGYRSCKNERCGFIAYYAQWAQVEKRVNRLKRAAKS